jgi:hypothetical protein
MMGHLSFTDMGQIVVGNITTLLKAQVSKESFDLGISDRVLVALSAYIRARL